MTDKEYIRLQYTETPIYSDEGNEKLSKINNEIKNLYLIINESEIGTNAINYNGAVYLEYPKSIMYLPKNRLHVSEFSKLILLLNKSLFAINISDISFKQVNLFVNYMGINEYNKNIVPIIQTASNYNIEHTDWWPALKDNWKKLLKENEDPKNYELIRQMFFVPVENVKGFIKDCKSRIENIEVQIEQV